MTPRQFGRDFSEQISVRTTASAFLRSGRYPNPWLAFSPTGVRACGELIEPRQAHLWSTAYGAQPIVVLGIKLCERYVGPFLYQLVQTHTACPCVYCGRPAEP
jgi:hypothetical protein